MKKFWIVALFAALSCSGSDGLDGAPGERGADGEDGINGMDGTQGPMGDPGDPGENGMDGMVGIPGTACWDLSENGVCEVNTEDQNGDLICDVLDCVGEVGPEGAQGPAGAQGAQGPQGPAGAVGPQGPPGANGANGADGDPVAQCSWVTGSGCSLPGAVNSACTTSTTCPSGQTVIAGGCEGFTSVAVGRTVRTTANNAWQCYYKRITGISVANTLRAQAFCCP